jgi:hypothetical protein
MYGLFLDSFLIHWSIHSHFHPCLIWFLAPHRFDCCTFEVSFEIGKCKSCNFCPSFWRLTNLDLLNCHINFSTSLFLQKLSWNFDRDLMESVYKFGEHGFLTVLSLPVHEHRTFPINLDSFFILIIFYSFQCTSLMSFR